MRFVTAPPKSRQLADTLRKDIMSGKIREGGLLESARSMAAKLSVSKQVVESALDILEGEGFVRREARRRAAVVSRDGRLLNKTALIILNREMEIYQADIFSRLETYLFSKKVRTLVSMISMDDESAGDKISLCLRDADGVILSHGAARNKSLPSVLKGKLDRTVILRAKPGDYPYRHVMEDRRAGYRKLTEHLVSLGHKKIAYLAVVEDKERFEGFREGLESGGLRPGKNLIISRAGQRHLGFAACGELLKRGKPFTAVIAHNDLGALGVMERLLMEGLKIPGDVSVAGYDNLSEAPLYPVPLTSCGSDPDIIVKRAVDMIFGPGKTNTDSVVLSPELFVRESTAKVK